MSEQGKPRLPKPVNFDKVEALLAAAVVGIDKRSYCLMAADDIEARIVGVNMTGREITFKLRWFHQGEYRSEWLRKEDFYEVDS